jgi:hypothetical protein
MPSNRRSLPHRWERDSDSRGDPLERRSLPVVQRPSIPRLRQLRAARPAVVGTHQPAVLPSISGHNPERSVVDGGVEVDRPVPPAGPFNLKWTIGS